VFKKQVIRFVCFALKTGFHQHFHRLREALARSAGPDAFATTPDILAQKDALRPASALVFGFGAGAFKFDPVSRLYFSRPLAVSPAPCFAGNFSPRPTDKDTLFFAISGTHPACGHATL
jgi:hypothetical protein